MSQMSDGESYLLPHKLARRSHGEDPLPLIGARFLFLDRVDDENNINMIAIRDQVCVAKPHDISTRIKIWFTFNMGHGLSQQDKDLCAHRFCSGIGELCPEIKAEFGSRNIHFYIYREGLRQSPYFDPKNNVKGPEFYYHVGDGATYRKVGWLQPREKPIVVVVAASVRFAETNCRWEAWLFSWNALVTSTFTASSSGSTWLSLVHCVVFMLLKWRLMRTQA